jgi:PAS domain S-box-containing protein
MLRVASAGVALFAAAILISWSERWTAVLQVAPGSPSTEYNAALCLILCSAGVALLPSRFGRFAIVAGGLVAIVGIATALEYFSFPFGIDNLLVRDYIVPAVGAFPGRMSPLSADCFIILGICLIIAGAADNRQWALLLAGSLASVVAVIAAGQILGYSLGIQAVDDWGAYTRIAIRSAVAYLVLGAAILIWVWDAASRLNFKLSNWLTMLSSVTLIALITFASWASVAQMKNAIDWRTHTIDVISGAEVLLGDLTDISRGMRGYALTGEAAALAMYSRGVAEAPEQLSELRSLTRDNPSQVPRLDALAKDLADVLSDAQRLRLSRNFGSPSAALQPLDDGDGRIAMDRASADISSFTNAERALLVTRDAASREKNSNTVRLLVMISVLAPILLVLAHIMAGAEMSRRRRTEAKLQAVSSLQTAILNAANYAIIATSVDGIVTSFNSAAERWFGYDAAEVIGQPAPAAWHDQAEVRARAAALSVELERKVSPGFETFVAKARLGHRDENEWTAIRRDGSRFPVWLSVTAVLDVAGHAVGYVSVIADIAKRKLHDAELRLSEERFRRAFDDAPIGMALVGLTGRWLRVNRSLCDMIGYTDAELLKTDLQAVTHSDDLPQELELFRRVLAGEIPSYQMEARNLHKNGGVVFVQLTVSLVRDPSGTPIYFVKQSENITERREIDRMKGEFISTVSHELRTPLTSIRGSLGLIDAGVLGKLPEKAEAMLKIAYQNSERLVRIINDILDLEKSSSRSVQLHIESVSVPVFLREALAANQGYGMKYQVRFILESTPDIEVLADRDRLMQAMANLLSNAAKFSPQGSEVRVRACVRDLQVRFEVQDYGTGIPEGFRGRIFEKFAQADSSSSRRHEGTGLGLSITRQLVEAMNGTIGFATVAGKGTIFYFELPRAGKAPNGLPGDMPPELAQPAIVSDSNDDSNGLIAVAPQLPRILHVEDDADLSNVIEAAFAGKVELVNVGTLEGARVLLREGSFSVLMLDPGLADGDGLSLLDQLPDLGAGSIPVVVLSATEVSSDVRHRIAAVLVKSRVSESHIVQTILSLLPVSASS